MPVYVDGIVVPVPKKQLAAYKAMARKAGKVWREHKDKRLAAMMNPKSMPFDGKRMFWGGFSALVRV